MKIAVLWKRDYPWDVRIQKVCRALVEDGHEVHLLSRNVRRGVCEEALEGMAVHRLPVLPGRLVNEFLSIPASFNPLWRRGLDRIVREHSIDLILVRDLPLAMTGVKAARSAGLPVLLDMAETYPSLWRDHMDRRGLRAYNYLLRNGHVAEFIERRALSRVDRIVVVIEESRERLIRKGVPPEKIAVVRNTPAADAVRCGSRSGAADDPSALNLLYVGGFQPGRGLDTVVEALPALMKRVPGVRLVLVGAGDEIEEIRALAERRGVARQVTFAGWVDPERLGDYLGAADVCLVPHDVTELVNTTIPNKLFDYMACRRPVLVSNAAPLERIVFEAGCGLVFRARDPEDFARQAARLADPALRRDMGERGYVAFRREHTWEKDSEILKALVREMGGAG